MAMEMFSTLSSLWVKSIKALHGQDGGLDNQGCHFNGIWSRIVGTFNFKVLNLFQVTLPFIRRINY